ncbi:MAG: hypothetical protein M1282_06870 [Chloroflexi bacterium]|nr:hypothetical protein [Chloroflexota bacterium]
MRRNEFDATPMAIYPSFDNSLGAAVTPLVPLIGISVVLLSIARRLDKQEH